MKNSEMRCVINSILEEIKDSNLQSDIYIEKNNSIEVTYKDQKIEKFDRSMEVSIFVGLIKDKKLIRLSGNNLEEIRKNIKSSVNVIDYLESDCNIDLANNKNSEEYTVNNRQIENQSDDIKSIVKHCKEIEDSALCVKNIKSNGINITQSTTHVAFANTNNIYHEYVKSYFSASIEVIAESNDNTMNSGYDYYISSKNQDIDFAKIGRNAANHAINGLNPRKVKTCDADVIFNSKSATNLIRNFLSAINGVNVAQSSTFLQDKLNKKILPDYINIIDDPLNIDSPAYQLFDAEGVKKMKLYLVENGILKTWLLDVYNANKLKLESNGCAKRSSNGNIIPSYSNVYIESSINVSEDELISEVENGLYVTDVFGFGVNNITGDYSQGVKGLWILNGKISYPVNEITISGNLLNMLRDLKAANNIEFKDFVNSPSLYVGKMKIAGK